MRTLISKASFKLLYTQLRQQHVTLFTCSYNPLAVKERPRKVYGTMPARSARYYRSGFHSCRPRRSLSEYAVDYVVRQARAYSQPNVKYFEDVSSYTQLLEISLTYLLLETNERETDDFLVDKLGELLDYFPLAVYHAVRDAFANVAEMDDGQAKDAVSESMNSLIHEHLLGPLCDTLLVHNCEALFKIVVMDKIDGGFGFNLDSMGEVDKLRITSKALSLGVCVSPPLYR